MSANLILHQLRTVPVKSTRDRLPQSENAHELTCVRVPGSVTEVMLSQLLNAFIPIVVTPSGNTTDVNPSQLLNAPLGILVTLLPIFSVVIFVLPPNTLFIIVQLVAV